jgi:hypothetical protein
MKLIKFDRNTLEAELYNDELLALPCIKNIFAFADSIEIAYKELAYCWWIGWYDSPGNQQGLTGVKLENDARTRLQMPSTWKPHKDIYSLIYIIKDSTESPVVKAMQALRRAFTNSDIIINKISDRIEQLLNDTITPEIISQILAYQKDLMNIASDIPKRIATLRIAEDTVRREQKEIVLAKGDKVVTESMIPGL